MSIGQFNKEPAWVPDEKCGKRMKIFMKNIEEKYKLKFADYWDFHKWTVENLAEFWAEVWDFTGVIYSKPYDQVVDPSVPMEDSPKWFEGARLNLAENLLKFRDDHAALIAAGEDRKPETMSYKQLYEETRVYASALRKFGLRKGDVVACYMSHRTEAVIAMLAVTSIGAIWTGALPTVGPGACLRKLKQVKPKVLFTVEQFPDNKEICNLLKNIREIVEDLPSLEKVIIIPKTDLKMEDISDIKNSCFLEDFLKTAYNADGTLPELVFEQVSFSDPVFINFTSGSTGLPKTLVHGCGGLLNAARDYGLHWDYDEKSVLMFVNPVGWVSWNIMMYQLFFGSTVVTFEGLPYFLSPTYLWDLVDDLKITRLFVTASVCDELERRKYIPTEKHHLNSLEAIVSVGSVVKPRNYEFVFSIKKGIRFEVSYGTTEFMGFCLLNESTLPVYVPEISLPSLGIALECLDDEGNPKLGEMGEFVISKPFPSLLLRLWGDTNGEIFRKTYFSKYPGKFTIGDSIIINPVTKGIIVCGRSDETIKIGITRFGSAEIYNIVKLFPEIRDSLCVGQQNKDTLVERAVLFLQMEENHSFNEELVQRLRQRIAKELTPTHVPEVILEAPGIPYNGNGKKTEIIIKKIINKMPHNAETIVNSECLQFYYNVPELSVFSKFCCDRDYHFC